MKYFRKKIKDFQLKPMAKEMGYGQPFLYGGSRYMRVSCKSETIKLSKPRTYITAVNLCNGNIRAINRDSEVEFINIAFMDCEGHWSKDHLISDRPINKSFYAFYPKSKENLEPERDEIDEIIFTCGYQGYYQGNGYEATRKIVERDNTCKIAKQIMSRVSNG